MYADIKRDEAVAALQAARDRNDTEGMAAALADYNNWRKGEDSRAELHAAGGALIGGLGGGSAFSTIGGAAGAGMASKMAGTLNDISKGVASATGSDLIGNLAANIAAGVGGAAVGGTAGAAMASNVQLYNQSMDDERPLTGERGRKSPSLYETFLIGVRDALGLGLALEGGPPVGPSPALAGGGTAAGGMAGAAAAAQGVANAIFNSGNNDGAKGNVNVEPGATPDSNEVRAGQGLANSGYDVSHQPTANSQGTPGVRTADLSINGVGQVDVYTPTNTNPNSIVRNIEAKFDQANGVVVQATLPEADMASIAARTWGKPNGQNFNTIFFQNSNGQVFRFDRPTGGK
jgi:filamentous hemagglutinin